MSIQTVRTLLVNDPATKAIVGDQIGPRDAVIDQVPPYIVLGIQASEPYNGLSGFLGLNRTEIEVTSWAASYADAVALALVARTAIEAAGHLMIHEPGDQSAFQQDVTVYGHAYVYQVFDSDD